MYKLGIEDSCVGLKSYTGGTVSVIVNNDVV